MIILFGIILDDDVRIEGLSPETQYSFIISVKNQEGWSKPTVFNATTQSMGQ